MLVNFLDSLPDISVVILCYRAEDFVPVFVTRVEDVLKKRGISYELILVANYHEGSSDKTPVIARKVAEGNSHIRVVSRLKNGMMGWDMRTGLQAARAKTIAVIDGDGQMPPEDIIRIYDHLIIGGYDVAKTYRIKRYDPSSRLVISRIFNFVIKILFPKIQVKDVNGKPKIFSHKALHQLRLTSNRWFIDAEIIIEATYKQFKIGEIPTIFYANKIRPSFVTFRALLRFIIDMLWYWMKFHIKI